MALSIALFEDNDNNDNKTTVIMVKWRERGRKERIEEGEGARAMWIAPGILPVAHLGYSLPLVCYFPRTLLYRRKGSRWALCGYRWAGAGLQVCGCCAGQDGAALARLVAWCLAVYPLPTTHAQTNTHYSAAERSGCRGCYCLD